jgi:hypothetical protein
MSKRDWEPFDAKIADALPAASYTKLQSLDHLALTYRHRQAPFGVNCWSRPIRYINGSLASRSLF